MFTVTTISSFHFISAVHIWCISYIINPFAPGDFAKKRVLKLVEYMVFWSLSCYKELKLTTNPFTGRTLHGLLIQMQNISLRSSGMCRKQNFEKFRVFGFESDTAVLTLTFPFLSSPLFSLFLLIFFSLAGHLLGFILMGRVFRKAFGILGLGERKDRWAMEQDFHGDLQVNLAWFFAFFSGVLD